MINAATYVGDYGTRAIVEMKSILTERHYIEVLDYWMEQACNV